MYGIVGNTWQCLEAELTSEGIYVSGSIRPMTVGEIVLKDKKWPKQ